MKFAVLFAMSIACAHAFASVKVSNGTVTISVSGADADSWGESGSSAGSSDITLAYADAAKTIVNITGTNTFRSRTEKVDVQIPLKDLKQIAIYAVGVTAQMVIPGRPVPADRMAETDLMGAMVGMVAHRAMVRAVRMAATAEMAAMAVTAVPVGTAVMAAQLRSTPCLNKVN